MKAVKNKLTNSHSERACFERDDWNEICGDDSKLVLV